jgi:hypothetical protein
MAYIAPPNAVLAEQRDEIQPLFSSALFLMPHGHYLFLKKAAL